MNTTQDSIIENNYILREIKEIKVKPNIAPESLNITEELTEIHEIKEHNKKQNIIQKCHNLQNNNYEVEIKLEGESVIKKPIQTNLEGTEENVLCQDDKNDNIFPECKNENICPDCKKENICPDYKIEKICPQCANENVYPEYQNENICSECINKEINNKILCNECKNKEQNDVKIRESQIEFGIVDAPFLENKEEKDITPDDIYNLIENIFEKLQNDDIMNDCENLKITFKSLKEDNKNEIIEAIKIKIDNEEQEKRFNNLLELIC